MSSALARTLTRRVLFPPTHGGRASHLQNEPLALSLQQPPPEQVKVHFPPPAQPWLQPPPAHANVQSPPPAHIWSQLPAGQSSPCASPPSHRCFSPVAVLVPPLRSTVGSAPSSSSPPQAAGSSARHAMASAATNDRPSRRNRSGIVGLLHAVSSCEKEEAHRVACGASVAPAHWPVVALSRCSGPNLVRGSDQCSVEAPSMQNRCAPRVGYTFHGRLTQPSCSRDAGLRAQVWQPLSRSSRPGGPRLPWPLTESSDSRCRCHCRRRHRAGTNGRFVGDRPITL